MFSFLTIPYFITIIFITSNAYVPNGATLIFLTSYKYIPNDIALAFPTSYKYVSNSITIIFLTSYFFYPSKFHASLSTFFNSSLMVSLSYYSKIRNHVM